MAHTPGPWKGGAISDSIVSDSQHSYIYDDQSVAYYGGYLIAESVAPCNKALIAAAPDLLAACEALLTAMDEWSEDELSPVNQGARLALMAEARAAITKAHGDGS